ncbi:MULTISPECIES: ammonium transporter [Synechocystis]|uniref:Ammonium transporter n=1 Tax=Synechocystis salina LEGE 00031 TaxID=1828736 RepID=A0ABR9VNH7_9SYNC|nr:MULTISPECIES: ammonium transporter [Synechocystis]MBD2652552.1 ammonium transporter [Synechocystis sp. FACHB-383]MBE9194169.1 ammonium transporter [Synechocystis sp. LEGE 06083]MBE9240864.1 ammonium transporter [Synechocystis salina LEGE 00041]MBE9252626.1 ammonium transporter [Synechocystis salina LEGE 00031]
MSNSILSKLNVGERSPVNRTHSSRIGAEKSSLFRFVRRKINSPWLACVPLTALIVAIWNAAAIAQDVEVLDITVVNESVATLQGTLNAIWILIAAILVIFMNAGFGMLETGLCRQKNAVNILTKNLIVFALATIAYWAIGFSLMFGSSGNPFFGFGGFFLAGDHSNYGLSPFPEGLPVAVFFLFQVAFSATAATIVSGAVAERIKFNEFLIFSVLLVGIAYPITGHWVWDAGGWLYTMGFIDFAGSTVVHSVGGWAALAGAFLLGPRLGKFVDGRPGAIPGHNMGFAMLGCLILWIGWFGFNPGSQLAADQACAYIAVTTNLAASAGGITATFTSWLKDGKPDLTMVINGVLAGLVGITAGCAGVSYWSSVIIGGIAGIIVVYSVAFFDKIKIDDPVGALSVHLVNGIWGTLAVGLFNMEKGLFYGGGINQLIIQIIGIATIGAFTSIFSFAVWIILKQTMGIRVSGEEEMIGLDIGEHGMEAYTGFVKETDSFGGAVSSAAVSE